MLSQSFPRPTRPIPSFKSDKLIYDPFTQPIIRSNGTVNIDNISTLQRTIFDAYPTAFYRTFRYATYHLDSGANVHATNNKKDLFVYFPIKSNVQLAVGSTAQCDGIGAILTQLTPSSTPILLAPVYYCPAAKISTLSPSALKHYNNFHSITIKVHETINFQRSEHDDHSPIHLSVHNNLDYLRLPVLHLSTTAIQSPILAGMFKSGINDQYIHQKFDHRNLDMIIHMKKQNLMHGLPSNISRFHDTYNCPICLLTAATKIPRTKFRLKDTLKAGEFFCFDYSFWTTSSIRGFTSLLSAICMKTRYTFVFPTRNKRPPLDTIGWFIKTLRRQGFPVLYIQTDEGGELGRNSDFLKLLTQHECIYFGTGKSGSSMNGIIERPNRTIANSVRAKLLNAGLSDKFWCYAAEDSNFKLRRMLHTGISMTPYQAWTGTKPTFSDMKIWECHVYVVDMNPSRTKLANRTYVGLFMKFSSTTKIIVYYNPSTQKFGRASHAYFDELNIGLHDKLHTRQPGTNLIEHFPKVPENVRFSTIQSDLSSLPILHEPAVTYEVYLPPIDQPCPIKFHDDDKYGLPYVKIIHPTSPLGQQLPEKSLKDQWIFSLGNEEPIHAASAHDEFTRLRTTHANKKIKITMAPRVFDSNNIYEQERTKFDQLRPILASVSPTSTSPISTVNKYPSLKQVIDPDNNLHPNSSLSPPSYDYAPTHIVPTISTLVHSSSRPTIPTNIQDCFSISNPHRSTWIQTIFEQYDKNASYRVFTRPIQKHTLHTSVPILKSVLAPTVKATNIPSLWKLNIRHCVNGKPLKGMPEYGQTRASTVHPDTVRFQLAYSTSFNFRHCTFDCTNAFQCTFEDNPSKRIYCYLPPFYI